MNANNVAKVGDVNVESVQSAVADCTDSLHSNMSRSGQHRFRSHATLKIVLSETIYRHNI